VTTWCDIGPEGRLAGPLQVTYNATWPCANGTPGDFRAPALGVVLHTEAGSEAGTESWFNQSASQVSAFFSVAFTGAVHQYGPVNGEWMAWSQASGNERWIGLEHEDDGEPSRPFSAAQIHATALLTEALSWHYGFPIQAATDPFTQHGVTLHSEGGVPFGDHPDCPGPVRGAQRPDILAAAKTIRSQREAGGVTITSWKSDGTLSLAELASRRKVAVSTVLRVTAGHGLYDAPLAQYIDQVFSGAILPTAPVPAGAILWVPAN
jgi:hypothetical protein